jgi:8-oxo-dGTP pyrophosphatase MutT (NUDIX family)
VGLSGCVRAAGGVVWRRGPNGIEVLLIHRPRYGDWSFPKGKVKEKSGETDEEGAVREVEEEVGLRCGLGPELESTSYLDAKGRDKTVRYWAMRLPEGAQPVAGDGVDDWRWAPIDDAADELTWARDREVLRSLPVEKLP